MIAMRLAEHVEHTTDVDGMLDRMTPEQFNEWCAKDLVEPIGYQTQMLGLIAWIIHSYTASDGDTLENADFMPWLKYATKRDNGNDAARQMLKSMASAAGVIR